MKNKGVFAVVGMPYSGSTLLSFVLGSNPYVYNGADLHYLNNTKGGQCSLHKEKCDVLSQTGLEDIYSNFGNHDAWYDAISHHTGRPYVVDASKQLSFFEQVLPLTSKPVVVIALNKHPMRALASDLYNRLFDRKLKLKKLDDIHVYIKENEAEVKSFLHKRVNAIFDDVKAREALLESVKNRDNIVDIVFMRYEDYLGNPGYEFGRLFEKFGLIFENNYLNYTQYEHHPITGNMGPIWKMRNAGKETVLSDNDFRKSFYGRCSSPLVLDDKYQYIFGEKMIEWIQGLDEYNALVLKLGYEKISTISTNV